MTTGRLPPDFPSLFRGIRNFWSSPVVTGRHFSPHIKNIFGKMFRTCRNYRPFVATSSRGRSGVVRRPEGEVVRSPRVVTGRHRSSLGRHFWSLLVVTGRHFWSSRAHSKFIKIHKRSASPLRCSIAAAIQHRRCGAASAAGSGGSRIRAVRRRQRRDGCVKLRWLGLLQRRRRRGRRRRGPESGWWQARGSNLNGGGRGGGLKKKETDQN